ncbi:MAG: hypothetical protein OEM04_07780, partial [Flavobacteriaceae bacterium]|nr:hypothetical protein [Flavobacteriaceae bacterium]
MARFDLYKIYFNLFRLASAPLSEQLNKHKLVTKYRSLSGVEVRKVELSEVEVSKSEVCYVGVSDIKT